MDIEQVKPNKPSFAMVVYLFAGAIIALFVCIVIVGSWRAKGKHKAPYSKAPTSQVYLPQGLTRAA